MSVLDQTIHPIPQQTASERNGIVRDRAISHPFGSQKNSLRQLKPILERTVFLYREVFDLPFDLNYQ